MKTRGVSMNQFATDLYKNVEEKGNFFFSPYSVHVAMMMPLFGAAGKTHEELCQALGMPPDAARRVAQNFVKTTPGVTAVNALWGQAGVAWGEDYLKTINAIFLAGMREADFVNDKEGACRMINNWVSEETAGKIKDLVPVEAVTHLTRLILTNAVHFKGDWVDPFEADKTKDEEFFGAGKTVTVPTMFRAGSMQCVEREDHFAVLLPYKGYHLSMLLLVPKEKEGLARVEAGFDAESLRRTLNDASDRVVYLHLPRFAMGFSASLKKPLVATGVRLAFSDDAELTGLAPGLRLKIDDVLHKAWVETNEKGTEAAAATAVLTMKCTAAPAREAPLVIRADRPFSFAIVNNGTRYPLFMGRVAQL